MTDDKIALRELLEKGSDATKGGPASASAQEIEEPVLHTSVRRPQARFGMLTRP
jgi:hypothetical protein